MKDFDFLVDLRRAVSLYFDRTDKVWPEAPAALLFAVQEIGEASDYLMPLLGDFVRNNPENHPEQFDTDGYGEELGDVILMALVAGYVSGVDPLAAMLKKIGAEDDFDTLDRELLSSVGQKASWLFKRSSRHKWTVKSLDCQEGEAFELSANEFFVRDSDPFLALRYLYRLLRSSGRSKFAKELNLMRNSLFDDMVSGPDFPAE